MLQVGLKQVCCSSYRRTQTPETLELKKNMRVVLMKVYF